MVLRMYGDPSPSSDLTSMVSTEMAMEWDASDGLIVHRKQAGRRWLPKASVNRSCPERLGRTK